MTRAVPAVGAYERLYKASDPLLWSSEPGRIVARAARLLTPGRALDIGCGDGRNALWLEERGWIVDGLDVSPAALAAARCRFARAGRTQRGTLDRLDVAEDHLPSSKYDLVLVYGLYHCIPDSQLESVHEQALHALRPGGLMAFSALTNRLPVPDDHNTGRLWLRSPAELRRLMAGLRVLHWDEGDIVEDHLPLVGQHRHAAVWGLAMT